VSGARGERAGEGVRGELGVCCRLAQHRRAAGRGSGCSIRVSPVLLGAMGRCEAARAGHALLYEGARLSSKHLAATARVRKTQRTHFIYENIFAASDAERGVKRPRERARAVHVDQSRAARAGAPCGPTRYIRAHLHAEVPTAETLPGNLVFMVCKCSTKLNLLAISVFLLRRAALATVATVS
jgi:hypothetical protein